MLDIRRLVPVKEIFIVVFQHTSTSFRPSEKTVCQLFKVVVVGSLLWSSFLRKHEIMFFTMLMLNFMILFGCSNFEILLVLTMLLPVG